MAESHKYEQQIKDLEEKLVEAANEIMNSAKLIELLKLENNKLRLQHKNAEEISEYSLGSDLKNECDEAKEKNMVNKLKKKVNSLNKLLKETEELITLREKEVFECYFISLNS